MQRTEVQSCRFPANMLFQGAFEEMQRKDKSVDPLKLANKLGFRGTKWKTLSNRLRQRIGLSLHGRNSRRVRADNYIYTLKKQ